MNCWWRCFNPRLGLYHWLIRKAYGHSNTNWPRAWTLVDERTLIGSSRVRFGPIRRTRLAGYRVGAGPGVRLRANKNWEGSAGGCLRQLPATSLFFPLYDQEARPGATASGGGCGTSKLRLRQRTRTTAEAADSWVASTCERGDSR